MMLTEEFKSAEIRVAAHNDLTAEQGRALYAAYVKRGVQIDRQAEEVRRLQTILSERNTIVKAIQDLTETSEAISAQLADMTFSIEDHGCKTGDCPHDKQADCDKALAEFEREVKFPKPKVTKEEIYWHAEHGGISGWGDTAEEAVIDFNRAFVASEAKLEASPTAKRIGRLIDRANAMRFGQKIRELWKPELKKGQD